MIRISCLLCIFSATFVCAQDTAATKRISKPAVPNVSSALFGDAKVRTTATAGPEKSKTETSSKTEIEVAVEVVEPTGDLPELTPLPGAETTDPLALFAELPPLPQSSLPSQQLKKKVNGKWVITSRRDAKTQYQVREVNGRKVISPK